MVKFIMKLFYLYFWFDLDFGENYIFYNQIFGMERQILYFITKLWNQISHPNRTLSTAPLILNKGTGLMLTNGLMLIKQKYSKHEK